MQISLLIALFLATVLLPPDAAQVEIRLGEDIIFAERGEENRWHLYEIEDSGRRDDLGTLVVTDGSVTITHNDQERTIDMARFLKFDDQTDWATVRELEFADPDRYGSPIRIDREDQQFRLLQDPPKTLREPIEITVPQAAGERAE